jgi:hypothetical protein
VIVVIAMPERAEDEAVMEVEDAIGGVTVVSIVSVVDEPEPLPERSSLSPDEGGEGVVVVLTA